MELATTIQLAQIVIICAGGAAAIIVMRNAVGGLKESLKAASLTSEKQFASVQAELKELGKILIDQARFDEKLTSLDKRVTSHGTRIDELARGDGWVQRPRRTSVDGEYPGP